MTAPISTSSLNQFFTTTGPEIYLGFLPMWPPQKNIWGGGVKPGEFSEGWCFDAFFRYLKI